MQPSVKPGNSGCKIAFIYLGRNPGFGAFVFDLARATHASSDVSAEFLVADRTELAARLIGTGAHVVPIPTFYGRIVPDAGFGILRARRMILDRLARTKPDYVVTLMPHIWSPLLSPAIRRRGHFYATLIHDAEPHPGDPTAWATPWLARDARQADLVFVMSKTVGEQLRARKHVQHNRIIELFHPDLEDGRDGPTSPRESHRPFRVLFFGRIMAYKGLGVLVEAIEQLKARGVPVHLGVAGAGDVGSLKAKLALLDAELIEGWVPSDELRRLLNSYDAVACSHVEASQSGVAAMAFAYGLPVIAAPVGGLAEQVVDGRTGVQASAPTGAAFADAIERLAQNPELYRTISRHLIETASERSVGYFLSQLAVALRANSRRPAG